MCVGGWLLSAIGAKPKSVRQVDWWTVTWLIFNHAFGKCYGTNFNLMHSFRFMHARLRTHAESIAFFGGGAREKVVRKSLFLFSIHVI